MDGKFQEYKRLVLAAIQEKDSEKQQDLIQRILEINADISQDIRDELTKLHSKSSSAADIIQNLTDQLLEYQKQYAEIQQSNNKIVTLRMIYADSKQKLDQVESMYNVYLIGIIVLCIIIGILVIKTAFKSSYSSIYAPITAVLNKPIATN